jgi:hypothetical protein
MVSGGLLVTGGLVVGSVLFPYAPANDNRPTAKVEAPLKAAEADAGAKSVLDVTAEEPKAEAVAAAPTEVVPEPEAATEIAGKPSTEATAIEPVTGSESEAETVASEEPAPVVEAEPTPVIEPEPVSTAQPEVAEAVSGPTVAEDETTATPALDAPAVAEVAKPAVPSHPPKPTAAVADAAAEASEAPAPAPEAVAVVVPEEPAVELADAGTEAVNPEVSAQPVADLEAPEAATPEEAPVEPVLVPEVAEAAAPEEEGLVVVEAAPVEEVPTEGAASLVEAPAAEVPVEETPPEDAVVEASPATENPAIVDAPADEAQTEETQTAEAETEEIPAETVPAADESLPGAVVQEMPGAKPETLPSPEIEVPEAEAAALTENEGASSTFEPTPSLIDRGEGAITEREPPAESEATETPVADGSTTPADPRPIAQFATTFVKVENKPTFAVVLIDPGSADLDRAALAALPFPISFALDPLDPATPERAAIYRGAGKEVVMLVTGIAEGAQASDVEVAFQAMELGLPEAVAVMDLAEAKFQNDRQLASTVVPIVKAQGRGLLTWDQGLNAADQVARRDDLEAAVVFRDLGSAGSDRTSVRRILDRAVFKAGQDGSVTVVGEADPETVAALLEWTVEGKAATVVLAPLTAVLKID